MGRALRKTLAQTLLGALAILGATSLARAQPGLPMIERPAPQAVIPAVAPAIPDREAPPNKPAAPTAAPKANDAGAKRANLADELKTRIERLEKQNQELLETLKTLQVRPAQAPAAAPAAAESDAGGALNKNDVQKIIGDYLKHREAQAKSADDAKKKDLDERGYVVGQNLGLNGIWTTGSGSGGWQPWFESRDKAYRVHFGGRFHPDWIFGAGSNKDVDSGKGGTGPFRESFDLRRARLGFDGWIGEVVDFDIEFDFAQQYSTGAPFTSTAPGTPAAASGNTVANTITPVSPTDVWAGINHIPVVGGVRIGNLKFPLGLDHLTSSRFLDFMERSSGFDTYYNRANGFEPGFMVFNNTPNELVTWQISATKPDLSLFDISQGGGQWRYAGRLTGLPWYEDNGRRMIHLGLGACYIDHLDQGQANLVGRWLLRNGGNNLQNVVGLARVFGASEAIINPEFFMNLGPLSVQAEYIGSQVNGATSYVTQLTGNTPVKISERNFVSSAAYIQAMYFLTGENRPYGKTALHGSGAAPTRIVPYRNYFWVPGVGGAPNPFSSGAWQVGVRYCYSDLNSNGIYGGIVNELTFGLNWFLNPNMKIQWNYDIGHRALTGGTSDGNYYGFGMRMAFDF